MSPLEANVVATAAGRVRELADLLGSPALADAPPGSQPACLMAVFELGTIHGLLVASTELRP